MCLEDGLKITYISMKIDKHNAVVSSTIKKTYCKRLLVKSGDDSGILFPESLLVSNAKVNSVCCNKIPLYIGLLIS